MTHVVILPYFSQEEIDRYLRILKRISSFPEQCCQYRFLLAASPKTEPSTVLHEACEQIAPTTSFQCPTKIFGYPQGPTAMFWDCLDFVGHHFAKDGGFGLWLESDMAPVKPNWMDRLDAEWQSTSDEIGQTPLMMGCYVPKVYKSRLLRQKKLLLVDHINGGACYAKDFATLMPVEARQGVFDVAVYEFAKRLGRIKATELIDFSTESKARRDVLDPQKVILHGFMQDKDKFIDACLLPMTPQELRQAYLHPFINSFETAQRRLRVWFVRRGHRAMYENMLLAKNKHKRAA